MIIDCNSCALAGVGCHDCVVTVLLGPPADGQLAPVETAAISVLSESGLIPPLRMVAS